jgi:hypothetical protein
LNNNRNNRRRGRGNRNQSGNGNQVNRIDSRARGNAPQLLDKYKKLAQDAQHNGDRVQMEYYLQFADHYFRVIADNKARQEESRGRRFEERDTSQDEGDNDSGDDFDFDRPRRAERAPRPRRDEQPASVADDDAFPAEGEFAAEGEPFMGDPAEEAAAAADAAAMRASARRTRQRKPREDGGDKRAAERPERAAERADRAANTERSEKPRRKPRRANGSDDDAPAGIDSSVLPPSIHADDAGEGDGNLEAVG